MFALIRDISIHQQVLAFRYGRQFKRHAGLRSKAAWDNPAYYWNAW